MLLYWLFESSDHLKSLTSVEHLSQPGWFSTVPGLEDRGAPLLTHRTPAEAAPTRRAPEHTADRGRFQVVQPKREAD